MRRVDLVQRCLLIMSAVAVAGCGATARLPLQPSGMQVAAPDTTAKMVATLRSAHVLDSVAFAVWPGFRLNDQVLIITAPSGPTLLTGVSNPPNEFRSIASDARIYLREGVPPDSLTGLRIGAWWNGRRATAVGYSDSKPLEILIHEAFHTYQDMLRNKFPSGATPQFPDTSLTALSLLNLEGRYLAEALGTPSVMKARSAALTALAVRARRCELLGNEECDAERELELNEGSATYVTALTLGHQPVALADSIQPMVSKVEDLPRTQRFHFYDTGLAWLLLLDRFGPSNWKERLGPMPPDSLVAEQLGFTSALRDSLLSVATQSNEAVQARKDAEQALAAEAILADSVARAFAAQPGIPVRIRWQTKYGPRSSQWVWLPGRRRSVRTLGCSGDVKEYVIGAREARYGFAEEGNQLVIRAPALWICCRAQGVEVRASVTGQVAHVDGTAIPLDLRARNAVGALTLVMPEVEFHARRAELNVQPDSVTIWLRPSGP